MNRQKSQLVKAEKENEIKRKKTTTVRKDKAAYGKTETVWERLSRVNKPECNENSSPILSKSKTTIRTKSNYRANLLPRGTVNSTVGNRAFANQSNITSQIKKPLTPNNNSNKRLQVADKKAARRIKSAKVSYENVVGGEVPLVRSVESVKEILTARSMCNSKTSSADSKKSHPAVVPPKSKLASACQTDFQRDVLLHSYSGNTRQLYNSHTNRHIKTQGDTLHCQHDYNRSTYITSSHNTKSNIPVKSPAQSRSKNLAHKIPKEMNIGRDSHHLSTTSSQQYSSSDFVTAPNSHETVISTKRYVNTSARSYSNSPKISPRANNNQEYSGKIESLKHLQESLDDYQRAPHLGTPARESLSSGTKIENNIEGLLKKKEKRMMTHSELKLIKRVIRSDERYRQLHQIDEKLCKDILKTQLHDIMKQGMIVKSALRRLDTTESEMGLSSNSSMEKPVVYPERSTDRQHIDVIFKNVPTLEKEIIILRALGEKLEATLKRTDSRRNLYDHERKSTATSMMKVMHQKSSSFVVGVLHYARVRVRTMGNRRCLGFAKEFHIEQKTIVELKRESERHFYLPFDSDQSDLKRTNFKRLKQHPDVLMRYLKPKNSMVPFNVLEQDPIFFNSFIFNMVSMPRTQHDSPRLFPKKKLLLIDEETQEKLSLHEGGDSTDITCPTLPTYSDGADSGGSGVGIRYGSGNGSRNGSRNRSGNGGGNESGNGPDNEVVIEGGNASPSRSLNESANGSVNECANESIIGSGKECGNASGNGNDNGCDNNDESVAIELNNGSLKENRESSTSLQLHVAFKDEMSDKDKKVIDKLPIEERISQVRARQRRRIRRAVTPMPLHKNPEPKNHLMKTILVGSLQISVFLLLIMAITYPDLKC